MDESLAASLAASLSEPDPAPASPHMVFFTTTSGLAEAERYAGLGDAVARVETLCNAEGVTDALVFALTPVPLRKRQLWRFEAGPADEVASPALSAVPVSPAVLTAVPPAGSSDDSPPPPPATAPVRQQPADEPLLAPPAPAQAVSGPEDADSDRRDVLPPAPAARSRGLGFFVH